MSDDTFYAIVILLLFGSFAIYIMYLIVRRRRDKKKKRNDSNYRIRKLNSSIYGKYEVIYDVNSFSNRNGGDDVRYLELLMKKLFLECSDLEFEICLPKKLLNNVFETDLMNDILDSYHKLAFDNFQNIKKEFINQAISNLVEWYGVSNSTEGRELLNNKGSIYIKEIEIDKNSSIKMLYCRYDFEDNNDATFSFRYNTITRIIDDLDVTS